jgi:2,5-diamino-6-(ribosylamino)-4(3H)-pyrimidinone 5'-phosphate reductase
MQLKVIMHNTVSLDGSIKDFEVDLNLHYQIASEFEADTHLIGSTTAKTGIEIYNEEIPQEEETDFIKPEFKPSDDRPIWVIPDSRGILENLLHVYRRSGYSKDVVILVSEATPKSYLAYLRKRHYDYVISGEDHVDYYKAFETLNERYNTKTILVDSGGTLSSILLENDLIDKVSIIISPVLVGEKVTNLFRMLHQKNESVKLELLHSKIYSDNHLHLIYRVLKEG